jgi:GH25 family lysozyme M1 (1,4-beta-N-acetylmuramidase)/uncharacterized protein YgiM (DUF1202 family)
MPNIIGPDVSFYQDDPETPQGINFVKMKESTEFVIVRAGQNLWIDPDFKYNYREAKLAGLRRGSYWFYDSRANPKRQAELWYQSLEGDLGELPLFADFEDSYGGQYKGWRQWFDFLERLKELVGSKEIAIYTAFYYWRDNAPNATTQASNLEYFHQYPLWIANYGATKPNIPKPWKADEWLFWQFTEVGDGALYGVESKGIDLNYFNGDLETFKARFPAGPVGPPPPPPPKPGPGTKHRVTVAALRMRAGPGTNTEIIGRLKQNDIVVEITANTDRTWIKVTRSDGLVGWVSNEYLIVEEIPDAPPPPPDPEPTNRYFKATTRLKVREGPGTTFSTLGILDKDDIVEEIGATTDRSWLQIKRNDGLTGWSFSTYLTPTDSAPPPPPPPPPPVPVEKEWYRVVPATLIVRAEPGPSAIRLGALQKDDIVPALEESEDKTWAKIRRVDGLTGWCHKNFLALLGEDRPSTVRQRLAAGILYFRKASNTPRPIVTHALTIDLRASEYHFIVTPPDDDSGGVCTRTVSEFLQQFEVHVAINGDGFTYLNPAPPNDYCPDRDAVMPNGFAASRGRIYSERGGPTVYVNQNNEITFNIPKGKIFNAISGDRMVLVKGKPVANLATNIPNPRTALGLSSNGRVLVLIVVDGRQPGYSEGVDFPELAALLTSFGAYTGVNMDGGGSSALVIRGVDGLPRVLNTPIDSNVPGRERSLANHLGIFIKK